MQRARVRQRPLVPMLMRRHVAPVYIVLKPTRNHSTRRTCRREREILLLRPLTVSNKYHDRYGYRVRNETGDAVSMTRTFPDRNTHARTAVFERLDARFSKRPKL